uniref:Globin domain-containing protein n=1 Tax=Chromulina nebulosa TaxID=96789 RepID=A0A7S0SYC4_9STRA|mmetsp:Transcript_5158/g.4648  ORF Transcript_5158/g.4648 Transcript_5158/m.4648 type:complete len:241 (+) Transcript_5158:85-807(+)
MGSGASKTNEPFHLHTLRRSDADIVNLMLPVYYTSDPVTKLDITNARASWSMIIDDTSPEYLRLKDTPDFNYSSCVMFYYDTFYARFFDVHPMSRAMFKSGLKTQGKFLVKMITLCLGEIDDADSSKFVNTLVNLTESHNARGVKSIEYGIVGEVLFFTLKHCLGVSIYTKDIHEAWVRIFSRMLTVIVPVAVSFEIKTGGQAQRDRVIAENALQKTLMASMTPEVSIREKSSIRDNGNN